MAAKERLQINSLSKATAVNDGEPWAEEELEWLRSWEGGEDYLMELAEMLGRTIEACREKFYKDRKNPVTQMTRTVKATNYRGWMESDGHGWD